MPYNNSDKDDERKKKQNSSWSGRWSICVWNGRKKELRCQNVREQCGDVKESDAGKKAERGKERRL